MIRYDKILVSAIISLLYSITVLAQNTDDWQIKGFVDTYHSVRSEKPFDFMSSRTRVEGRSVKALTSPRCLCHSMLHITVCLKKGRVLN